MHTSLDHYFSEHWKNMQKWMSHVTGTSNVLVSQLHRTNTLLSQLNVQLFIKYHRQGLLWPLFGISDFFLRCDIYVMILEAAYILLAPFWLLTLIFFLFEKKYCYIIYFLIKGGQCNPAGQGYFGHPYKILQKMALGSFVQTFYKCGFFSSYIIHYQWHFHDAISQNRCFCFKAKIECGVTLATHQNKDKNVTLINGFIKKLPK